VRQSNREHGAGSKLLYAEIPEDNGRFSGDVLN